MREIERLDRILSLWLRDPDQLLHNCGFPATEDHYNVEDEKIEEVFDRLLKNDSSKY